ncbi:hypothetical protein [Amycolatopsis vastitatis]|uniref:hypothetical protein n=1 Tax=Amycolatopsis vastitatis TaxID=1905142 RepID=UPI0011782E7C|nr:hypothetical protein [Amycolatopsis vastitatis]
MEPPQPLISLTDTEKHDEPGNQTGIVKREANGSPSDQRDDDYGRRDDLDHGGDEVQPQAGAGLAVFPGYQEVDVVHGAGGRGGHDTRQQTGSGRSCPRSEQAEAYSDVQGSRNDHGQGVARHVRQVEISKKFGEQARNPSAAARTAKTPAAMSGSGLALRG